MKVKVETENSAQLLDIKNRAEAKIKAFNDGIELVKPFISITTKEERKAFLNDMVGYVTKELRSKIEMQSLMTDERVQEFFEVPVTILKEIQKRVRQDVQILFNNDLTNCIIPDIEIYAENDEELERLNVSLKLISVINEFTALAPGVHMGTISKGFQSSIIYSGGTFKPNPIFIKRLRY